MDFIGAISESKESRLSESDCKGTTMPAALAALDTVALPTPSSAAIEARVRSAATAERRCSASAKLAELLVARTTRSPVSDREATVGRLLDEFTADTADSDLTPGAQATHRWAAAQVQSEIGTVRASELKVLDVEVVLRRMATKPRNGQKADGTKRPPLGEAFLREVRNTLSQSMQFAVRNGRLAMNLREGELAGMWWRTFAERGHHTPPG